MATVTLDEIKARYYRALTPDEERLASSWIEDAEAELLDLAGYRLAERLTDGEPGLAERIERTVRAAVLRRLQNPQGLRQYSYTIDDATVSETRAAETLAGAWFTDDELARLAPAGLASDAFSIRTDAGLTPTPSPLTPPTDEWYPWTRL